METTTRRESTPVKFVILDGRTLYPDREAWSGLDTFGEVVYHDFSAADEVPERADGRRSC